MYMDGLFILKFHNELVNLRIYYVQDCQKIILLKNLNEDTYCAALTKEVVGKCSLIHPRKLEEVEQLSN
jgi:hypothetical protein